MPLLSKYADRLALPRKFKTAAIAFCLAFALIGCAAKSGVVTAVENKSAGDLDGGVENESGGANGIQAVAVGGGAFIIIDGKVYAAGNNYFGRLGVGDDENRGVFEAVSSLIDKNITAIAAGEFHAIALAKDGKVYAAGRNHEGQLGLGGGEDIYSFTEIQGLSDKKIASVFAGGFHSFALAKDGKVYAAGHNYYGQLGLGDRGAGVERNAFTEIKSLSDKRISALFAGKFHSFALAKDGKVYGAGYNEYGQLGLSGEDDRESFTEIADLNGKNIIAIAAGSIHSLALAKDGKVYAAGRNYNGQLGLGGSGEGTDRNAFTEVTSLKGKNIVAIDAKMRHSLALTNDGKVYATGDNGSGQLGLGPAGDGTENFNVFTEAPSLSAKNIKAITACLYSLIALTNNDELYSTEEYSDESKNDALFLISIE